MFAIIGRANRKSRRLLCVTHPFSKPVSLGLLPSTQCKFGIALLIGIQCDYANASGALLYIYPFGYPVVEVDAICTAIVAALFPESMAIPLELNDETQCERGMLPQFQCLSLDKGLVRVRGCRYPPTSSVRSGHAPRHSETLGRHTHSVASRFSWATFKVTSYSEGFPSAVGTKLLAMAIPNE